MKCVVTIIQNKRVALPFIFGRYCLPKMRKVFGGQMELYHIFHDLHVKDDELESNRSHGLEHLDRVNHFIKKGLFSEAFIVRHQERNIEHLAIPSFLKAARIAIRENADFHVWLEDDAIILDKECNKWKDDLKNADVGLYRDTRWQKMINCAFFVSTREFDKRMVNIFSDYQRDNTENYIPFGSQVEHFLWRASKSQALLKGKYAERHHPSGKWKVHLPALKKWLVDAIPEITQEHLDYLNLDFDF
jgi:hypothetical protein